MSREHCPQNGYKYGLESTSTDFLGFEPNDAGAVLESITLIQSTLGVTGTVTVKDGAEAAVVIYTGNPGGITLMRGTMPLNYFLGRDGMRSRSGKFTVTTGVGIRILVTGRFK